MKMRKRIFYTYKVHAPGYDSCTHISTKLLEFWIVKVDLSPTFTLSLHWGIWSDDYRLTPGLEYKGLRTSGPGEGDMVGRL